MDTHTTAIPCSDDSLQDATAEDEKDFPTAPLDDDIWLEDPVQDTSASMNSHNHMTSVPIPVHTAWTCYTPPQKMHQHHIMR